MRKKRADWKNGFNWVRLPNCRNGWRYISTIFYILSSSSWNYLPIWMSGIVPFSGHWLIWRKSWCSVQENRWLSQEVSGFLNGGYSSSPSLYVTYLLMRRAEKADVKISNSFIAIKKPGFITSINIWERNYRDCECKSTAFFWYDQIFWQKNVKNLQF